MPQVDGSMTGARVDDLIDAARIPDAGPVGADAVSRGQHIDIISCRMFPRSIHLLESRNVERHRARDLTVVVGRGLIQPIRHCGRQDAIEAVIACIGRNIFRDAGKKFRAMPGRVRVL